MFKKNSIACCAAIFMSVSTSAYADDVEIYLTDMLDNKQVGYCVDIAKGKGENANPADGLQSHTCYSNLGALGYDQTFDTEKFASGVLYMKNFDVCAEWTSTDAGSSLGLAACDSSKENQAFVFSGEGTITPKSATGMCFTAGKDTRSGRSDANQIKTLTLEECSTDLAAYQTWAVRGLSN